MQQPGNKRAAESACLLVHAGPTCMACLGSSCSRHCQCSTALAALWCDGGASETLAHTTQLSVHVQVEARVLADCIMATTHPAPLAPPLCLPLPGDLAHAGPADRTPALCLRGLALGSCPVGAWPAGGSSGKPWGSSGGSWGWAPGWGGSPACWPQPSEHCYGARGICREHGHACKDCRVVCAFFAVCEVFEQPLGCTQPRTGERV